MFAGIFVPATANTYLGAFFFVLQGKDPAKKIIIQPTLADQIGCRQCVGSYHGSAQAVIGIFLLGLIFFIITPAPGQESCGIERQFLAELAVIEKLVMVLLVIVGL